MDLTVEEQAMLAGKQGRSAQKAIQILTALGKIYGAKRMIPVKSVQISGVSFDNLGEAGLEFLTEMADGGGKTRVHTTLNPAGMDIENWRALGISEEFARNQRRVIEAFVRMGVTPTCTCTPYLAGNLPELGDSIAWAESSAVCYANSVLGARTNREGGPSALAAALTGVTPEYGFHLHHNRQPGVGFEIEVAVSGTAGFGALGMVIGQALERMNGKPVPLIRGIRTASLEELKSFCASIATYGGAALFHMVGITPEAEGFIVPEKVFKITGTEFELAAAEMRAEQGAVDFVSLGCPHLSIEEITRIAELVKGHRVKKTFWITTSRPVKQQADRMGYTKIIEESGAIFATDTCCVVAPIAGRFATMATDSAKACYYGAARNRFNVKLLPFDEVVEEALR